MDQLFIQRLLETFRIEAEEHLSNISNGLISLENSQSESERNEHLEFTYREAHSLKGAARAVNFVEIVTICQNIESVFSAFKKNEIPLKPEIFDLLHKSLDILEKYIAANDKEKIELGAEIDRLAKALEETTIINFQNPQKDSTAYDGASNDMSSPPENRPNSSESENDPILDHIEKLKEKFLSQTPKSQTEEQKPVEHPETQTADLKRPFEKHGPSETIRISTSRLDKIFIQVEEIIGSKIKSEQTERDIARLLFHLEVWKKEWQKHSSLIKKLRNKAEKEITGEADNTSHELLRIFDFLDWNYSFLNKLEESAFLMGKSAMLNNKQFSTQLNLLLEEVREIMMLPFSHLLGAFPRIVRELGRDLNKDVEFVTEGTEIEVDKRILEELKDPLIHIIRNCIDHGIESHARRLAANKPLRGKISLRIEQPESGKVSIVIEDDGAGINTEALKKHALQKNFISAEEAEKMDTTEILSLIFRSGISTSPVITDISGRGLGMAIVKEKVEKLDGHITIDTKKGIGTKFTLTLPVTVAALRGITIKCNDRPYILPTTKVERVMRIKKADIKTIENRTTISINDIPVIIVELAQILELGVPQRDENAFITVFVLRSSDRRVAFACDEILDEDEILLKPFNKQIVKVKNIAGATISGAGKVIPILDTADLLRNAFSKEILVSHKKEKPVNEVKSILVADDSITSRMLVKDILESAGYKVKTAIDGMDAYSALKTGNFDCVVTDVEMPRMDGFELTSLIRKELKFADLPVVLVTGLSKREDREKGIEAGANAYIVKSSFDQSNLLETLKRLIV